MAAVKKHMDFDWNQAYSGGATDYVKPDADLLQSIEGLKSARALDIGCGVAGLIVALAQLGWRVTRIDVAEKAIASARAVARQGVIEAGVYVADITTWRPDSTYDLIMSSFALPTTKAGRRSAYALVREGLAPCGIAVIKDSGKIS